MRHTLIDGSDKDEIAKRATSALAGFVGGQVMLLLNLRDAVDLVRNVETGLPNKPLTQYKRA